MKKWIRIAAISLLVLASSLAVKYFFFDSWIRFVKPAADVPVSENMTYHVHLSRFVPGRIQLTQYSYLENEWEKTKTVNVDVDQRDVELHVEPDSEKYVSVYVNDEKAASFGPIDLPRIRVQLLLQNSRHLKVGKEQNFFAVGNAQDPFKITYDNKTLIPGNIETGMILSIMLVGNNS
ncbi:MAG: hypothetical protein SOI44_09645 [Lactimicrobium sp.]|jgi:hypothetical protein|uniref:hypothetical protein n=2 Tax=Lactimicrobium sp. TaxID=2563780 RepID=UPI002F352555